MANVYDIIIRPIITERGMAATADKKYTFEVAPSAGKIEIKDAVEKIFGVKVAKVNTINYDGKTKRMGAGRPGTRKSWKKLRPADPRLHDHRVLRGYGVRKEGV